MRKKTLQERVQQRNERPTHHKRYKKGTDFKHTPNKKNKTCENCDPMKFDIFKIHNSGKGVATERERE